MKEIPQGRYTKAFREVTVKLVTEGKLSIPEATQRLSLSPSTLGNWLGAKNAGKLAEMNKSRRPLTEIEMELAKTKRELVEVKMERDILTKAVACFAKESLPGTRSKKKCDFSVEDVNTGIQLLRNLDDEFNHVRMV